MIISIDVGGTKIAAALIEQGKILERREIPSVIHQQLDSLADVLLTLCDTWIERADALAVACTGQVAKNSVKFLGVGPDAELFLRQQLEQSFQLPVTIINDAAAAAWAEYAAREDQDTLVYITVSTGVGGGLVQGGRLVTSTDGFCAHLGHMSIPQPIEYQQECSCGRVNCVESISSGRAIARQASDILGVSVTCKEVFDHHLDNPAIARLLDRSAVAIVELIANIKAITGTEVVVLGGSLGLSIVFRERVQQGLALLPDIYRVTLLTPVSGANADLIGAALYSQHQAEKGA